MAHLPGEVLNQEGRKLFQVLRKLSTPLTKGLSLFSE